MTNQSEYINTKSFSVDVFGEDTYNMLFSELRELLDMGYKCNISTDDFGTLFLRYYV